MADSVYANNFLKARERNILKVEIVSFEGGIFRTLATYKMELFVTLGIADK